MSPFSKEFLALSQAEILWALMNHYKDQEEELEKFKLVCWFINPTAAKEAFGNGPKTDVGGTMNEDEFLRELLKDSGEDITVDELRTRIKNPEESKIDTIEVVE